MTAAQLASTEHSRFVFTPSQGAGEDCFGYHLEVVRDGTWRRVTAVDNVLVSGESFDLRPSQIVPTDGGLALSGAGRGAAGEAYTWTGTVRTVPGTDWFHVEVRLQSDGFRIGDHRSVEPQITVTLGDLPPYERGDHVWFKTLVANPTQWNNEGSGNDFPALFYYDAYSKASFRMFFDMTPMSWMGPDTIARFYGYRCELRRRFEGRPTAEIGLLAQAQGGHRFPDGEQVFSWYVSTRHVDDDPTPPSEQQALGELVESCLPLLRSSSGHWPERAAGWREIAAGCVADLMSTTHCWRSDEQGEFLLSYVDGRSDAWQSAMHARGRTYSGVAPCLEAALWALRPLRVLQAGVHDQSRAELAARLESFVLQELRRDRCRMLSGVSAVTTPMGTWQYIYMLAELWFLFADHGDERLARDLRAEIETVAIPLARGTQYLFPLQFDKRSLRKIGPGSAYAVSGTYALLMVDLAVRTSEARFVEEARNALATLANVPIDDAVQEVMLVAHAAEAACRLRDLTGDGEWDEARKYFRAQTLRMMYWYDDRTSVRSQQISHLGMFLACANIGYPAFFENIEVDARLASVLGAEDDPAPTLRVIDYGRRANFSFFPLCSPDLHGPMPLEYIPFEEVPILEGPNDAGFLGQEIYGAGFSFLAHLLWDAFVYARDTEVMVLNLAPYGDGRVSGSTWEGSFLLFNSKDEDVDTELLLPVAQGNEEVTVTLTAATGAEATFVRGSNRGVPVRLGAGQWARLRVHVDGAKGVTAT